MVYTPAVEFGDTLSARRTGWRRLALPLAVVLLASAGYAFVRYKRPELVDFTVYRTAAARAVRAEPLYRAEDGHYQYKYLPAFALAMAPVTRVSKDTSEGIWYGLTVGMLVLFLKLSLDLLPDRRASRLALGWIVVVLTGKFWIKELAFGQTNLLLGLLVLGAVGAARAERRVLAGAMVALAVFVKPYALVVVPWLAWSQGVPALASFAGVTTAGLLCPAAVYGWQGNLDLVVGWVRTVTDTVAPNLWRPENVSFAATWARWVGPGPLASKLATATTLLVPALACGTAWWRRAVRAPDYLEVALLLLLVPLLSPQGWDYVLLLGIPAIICVLDRWELLGLVWRLVVVLGLVLACLTIYDLMGRALFMFVMDLSGPTVGAMMIAATLVHLRRRSTL